ncbi:restriction endonuclease subunit S [Tsukamurella sp. PLM1]|uniref:restriction endonuclease subunit S n=1 Tax=Tsukamurella sp. PLM1 TaxID=2929795 RepID=UPI0020C11E6B|nr:restriction endonuclease subunit S [Tsukamurella sp. PLM1]
MTTQVQDVVRVVDGESYSLLGVRLYAGGPFRRETVTSETSKATRFFRVRSGQFIYNRLFAGKGAFGLVGPDLEESYVSNEFPVFDCDRSNLLPEFLMLHFRQPQVWEGIERVSTGTTASRNRWKESQFNDYRIALPSLVEQRRIVDVMAAVDAQILALSEEVEAKARTLSALRADVPDSDEVSISSIVQRIDSGKSVQTKGEEPVQGKARVLKLSAVQLGWFDANEAKRLDDPSGYTKTHLVCDGDLLITRSNTPERVGYVAVAVDVPPDTYMPDLIWRIRLDESRCLASYLEHLLSANEFRARITASASGTNKSMQKINKKSFGTIKIPVPDTIAEQEAYVATCDAVIEAIRVGKAELTSLRTFRSALLTSLLNQEIEIPESYDSLLTEVS